MGDEDIDFDDPFMDPLPPPPTKRSPPRKEHKKSAKKGRLTIPHDPVDEDKDYDPFGDKHPFKRKSPPPSPLAIEWPLEEEEQQQYDIGDAAPPPPPIAFNSEAGFMKREIGLEDDNDSVPVVFTDRELIHGAQALSTEALSTLRDVAAAQISKVRSHF